MNIFLKDIRIDILTFFVIFSVIIVYYSIGPTIWIDSLFHVAHAETFFFNDNYKNWYENNLIYHLNYLIYVLVISFLIAKIQSKLHSK